MGCCAQEHFISRVAGTAQLPCPPWESPSENAPAKLGAKIKYSILLGILDAPLDRQEGAPGKGSHGHGSKIPSPHHHMCCRNFL